MDVITNIRGAIKGFMVVSSLIKPPPSPPPAGDIIVLETVRSYMRCILILNHPLWHGHPYGEPLRGGEFKVMTMRHQHINKN